jgi:hypothetical protein
VKAVEHIRAKMTHSAAKLWKRIDIAEFKGTFVTLGDVDSNGEVDILLSYLGPYSSHLRLVALDLNGAKLWEFGDPSVRQHAPGKLKDMGTPCRGFCMAYDIDGDGRTEVLVEFWNDGAPILYLLDGPTGEVRAEIPSPFSMEVRHPEGYTPSRPSPMIMVAHLRGANSPPSFVLKYEASQQIPTHAVAFDAELNTIWHVEGKPTAMGHHADVGDIDGDGRDEIVFGELAVNGDGETVFEREFGAHADMVEIFDGPSGDRRIVLSICLHGPVYCLTPAGDTIWAKSKEEVPHGQSAWAGNFLPDRPGLEIVLLTSGHCGNFTTVDAEDGRTLARFEHRAGLVDRNGDRKYPDMPVKVEWGPHNANTIWIPVDRMLVDGSGNCLQDLGEYDEIVGASLHAGTSKQQLAAQAIAADLCGDDREEIVLYQPYHGEAIFIFTQPDSNAAEKAYVHRPGVVNRKSYF